jgi:hypothetical protein
MSRQKLFTDAQDEKLLKHWPAMGAACVVHFNGEKTKQQLRDRAKKLGVKRAGRKIKTRRDQEEIKQVDGGGLDLGDSEELFKPNRPEDKRCGFLRGITCSFVFDLPRWAGDSGVRIERTASPQGCEARS